MKSHLAIAYHSLNDPIVKGLLLKYLKEYNLNVNGEEQFLLITFEQTPFKMSSESRDTKKLELSDYGIKWFPLSYHTGGSFLLVLKAWDFLRAFLEASKILIKWRVEYIIGFTSISSSISWLIAKIYGRKLISLNHEPHSDYMVDLELWSKNGIKFKLLNWLELRILKEAHRVSVPTKNAARDFSQYRDSPLDFVPTCIDSSDFGFDIESRLKIRKELEIQRDDCVVIYVGKFGGIYLSIEEFGKEIRKLVDGSSQSLQIIIITGDNRDILSTCLKQNGIKKFHILSPVPYERLYEYMSAADAGLLILPDFSSQRYRCPIKTANYLASGLPIIVNEIVGDDSDLVRRRNVGWVLKSNNCQIDFDLSPKRQHCISVIQQERPIQKVVSFLDSALH